MENSTDTERELLRKIDTSFKEMVLDLIDYIKTENHDADLIREVRECYNLLIWRR